MLHRHLNVNGNIKKRLIKVDLFVFYYLTFSRFYILRQICQKGKQHFLNLAFILCYKNLNLRQKLSSWWVSTFLMFRPVRMSWIKASVKVIERWPCDRQRSLGGGMRNVRLHSRNPLTTKLTHFPTDAAGMILHNVEQIRPVHQFKFIW